MDAKNMIVSMTLVLLFSIAFISFGVQFAYEQDASISIADNEQLGILKSNLTNKVNSGDLQDGANQTAGAFDEDDDTAGITSRIAEFFIGAVTGVGKTMMNAAYSIFSIVLDPLLYLLFPNSQEIRQTVGGVLATIILFVMALITWKLIKTGT